MTGLIDAATQWHYQDAQIKIYIDTLDTLYAKAIDTLPTETLTTLRKNYKSATRQREKIAEVYVLPLLLPHGATISYAPNGRPYLIGSNLHISITHNEVYIAIALALHPVGIDIEQESQQLTRVSQKFFSTEEMKLAHTYNLPLAVLWSAKEAAYKWANRPGLSPLHDINLCKPTHELTKSPITLYAKLNGAVSPIPIHTETIDHETYLSFCLAEQ